MDGIKLNGPKLFKRIEKVYNILGSPSSSSLSKANSIVIIRGKFSEENKECLQPKSSLFHEYILGYDFTETLMLFTPKQITFFVASKKKLLLEKLSRPSNSLCPEITIVLRNPVGGNEESLNGIISSALKVNNIDQLNLGVIPNENGIGILITEWQKCLVDNKAKINLINIPNFVDDLLSIKDQDEMENIQIASRYSCTILELLNQKFENIIDDEKKVTHLQIANDIKTIADKPNVKKKFVDKLKNPKANIDNLEVLSMPIIQSGGAYNLSLTCDNDQKILSSDIIICKSSAQFHDYNGSVVRTFMIDADKDQQGKYKIIIDAFNVLYDSITEGKKLSEVYNKVKAEILSKDNSLEPNIPASFGSGIGLETNNTTLQIAANNNTVIKAGMCFNLLISLSNLKKDSFTYTIQIGDTIVLKNKNNKENYTESVSKLLTDIYYNMDDDDESAKKESKNVVNLGDENNNKRVTRQTKVSNDERTKLAQSRKDHQSELLQKKNEEFKSKMIDHATDLNEEIEENKINLSQIKAYDSKSEFPSDLRPGKIHIDNKNYAVFLPIFKDLIPFHVSLIKNVSKSEDGDLTVLRINFLIPVSGVDFGEITGTKPVFIRDITYKIQNRSLVKKIVDDIRNLGKNYKIKQQETKEKSELVAQEHLIQNKGKRVVLTDVNIRPNITAKKTTGTLESHVNGFKFLSNKGEKVEIIYKNIKHAFLQPCENELIALVHFHLKNPILIGKKKTHDIQFYKEAGSQADDLDMRRRGNDYEEYEIELKERQIREKINEEFSRFAKSVQEMKVLEFDVPYREMEFTGVPFKSNVTLLPTKYCLVSLVEMPVFVITLAEVDIVYFERVSQSLKNFDMTFIFKDLSRPVHRITAIPMENLDILKSWLDENDILFGEGLYNILWPKILQKIKSNPAEFLDEGGWGFIQENSQSDASDSDKEGDSDYEQAEDDDEEESEYSEESEDDDDDSDESEGDDDLSEEGLSWDELEKDAIRSDKEHAKRNEEEDAKKRKKRGKK